MSDSYRKSESGDSDCVPESHINQYDSIAAPSVPSVLEIVDLSAKTFRVSPVALKRSPLMMCHYKHFTLPVILDTGAENNVIGDIACKKFGLKILKTCSQVQQVDKSPLKSVGRIVITLENGSNSWTYDALELEISLSQETHSSSKELTQ